jgi:hypothetical protein
MTQKVSANNDRAICEMVLCQHVAKAGNGMVSLPASDIGRHWDGFSGSKLHTLLQELLKMKLSCGKVQAWE